MLDVQWGSPRSLGKRPFHLIPPREMTAFSSPTLRASGGAILGQVPAGKVISAVGGVRKWRHPWFVLPSWVGDDTEQNGGTGKWVATVKAGFVNDTAPVFQTTVREQEAADQDFGINPLTGRPFFCDPIFAQPRQDTTTRTIAIPLTLEPAIPLSLRAIGWDALAPTEPVPKFFLERGAAAHPQVASEDNLDSDEAVDDAVDLLNTPPADPPPGLRLLRVCDLILHQPRLALTSQIDIEPGLATGQTHVQQTLSIASEVPGDALRVLAGMYQPPDAASIDPLTGDYTEPPYDELIIAKVFLLSPPNTPPHSDADASWTAYVSHGLFWNLSYQPGVFRAPPADPGIGFIPPLAGGAGQIVINYLTSAISDMLQDALNLVTASSLAGKWWTPTGGGHRADFPLPTPAVAKGATGLDKTGRLAAQAVAAARARQAESLDPDYPYSAMGFDPTLLTPA
jgi:hypothetical protein